MNFPRKHFKRLVFTLTALSILMVGLNPIPIATVSAKSTKKRVARNIIIMIADGRGFNHIDAASYYQIGRAGKQPYNRFPVRLAMSTYMGYEQNHPCYGLGYDPVLAWSDFDYVKSCATDSAAAATAISTGVKTYGGVIGVDLDGQYLTHAIEIADEAGKSTGVVSSVEWTHATPAGFVAHNSSRNNYAEIGQEMVYRSPVDVIMGAGHPWFNQDGHLRGTPNTFKYVGGEATWADLVAGIAGGDADGDGDDDPWTLIETRTDFQALMHGPTPTRVLGTAQVYETLQANRSGNTNSDPFVVPFIDSVPTLEEMTKAALNILDDDPDGLFLMIEGGAVDWTSHSNRSGRMIEEHMDFDNSVRAVLNWVRANSNWRETLLIITSDHETGYLTGPDSNPTWESLVSSGAGNLPEMEWQSGSHTNSLVPFFARGYAARKFRRFIDGFDQVYGRYIDNSDIGRLLLWSLDPSWADSKKGC